MPAIHISRSIEIEASPEKVYGILRDFRTWPDWSPWLVAEKNATLHFSGDGKGYTWEGNYVGAGEIDITAEATNEWIQYDLLFLKPWKSKAAFRFELQPKGDAATEVTWTMEGSLPFFMFFLKKMMEAFIGMDYERGLLMIKDLAELGQVPVQVEFGESEVGPFSIVGIKTECEIDRLSEAMSDDIGQVKSWLETSGLGETGDLMTVYHKWEPVKRRVIYTTGFPVSKIPENLPDSLTTLEVPKSEAYTARLTGPYRHLANAWAAGIMRARSGAFKQSKVALPFEIYENSPEDTNEEALKTTVYFPMR